MALKSKGTAKAVVSAKPKVKALPVKAKGEKLTAAAAKPMAKAAVKATGKIPVKVAAKPPPQVPAPAR